MYARSRHFLRNVFATGLLVTVPLGFAIFVIKFLFVWVDNMFSPSITYLLIFFGLQLDPDYRIPGIGVGTTVVLIFLIGLLTRNIVGKSFVKFYESILVKIPVFKNIYVGTKQVLETIASSSGTTFSKVVLIEYPRKGIYGLGFVTGETTGEVQRLTHKRVINVFIPTTPNPTSGFFLLVPEDEVMVLEMSVEDAVKMIISAGLVTPPERNGMLEEGTGNQRNG